MSKEEFFQYYGVSIIVVLVTAISYYAIAKDAPLSEEAIARRALEQSKNPPATSPAPAEVQVGQTELAPEKIELGIENLDIFGFNVACIRTKEDSQVHAVLELLANEIGTGKIPKKYIETDDIKTITPESFKWAWLSYWQKTDDGEKICLTK